MLLVRAPLGRCGPVLCAKVVQTVFRQWTYDVDVQNAERAGATQTNLHTNKHGRVRRA
jgi:hypothetical protein